MCTVKSIENCCGCRACKCCCPVNAISFMEDNEGFFKPLVDHKLCISCGKCKLQCPQIHDVELKSVKACYAATHKEKDILLSSTSGGGMTAIAEPIIRGGGIVFGTYLDSQNWNVEFSFTDKLETLSKFRGSKYVQSNTQDSYIRVKRFLKEGRKVLFVGVPCQVAGLYSFLNNEDRKNLYTIDILCHGMTAPSLFKEHIRYLEKKYKRSLQNFSFRDKTKFPGKCALKYDFGTRKRYVLGKCEPYFQTFISGAAYQNCCYDCKYAQCKRVGDATLGDYWGIEKAHPEFDSSLGTSLILINSDKGMEMVKDANLLLIESDLKKAIIGNGILKNPSTKATCRDYFYDDIKKYGYETAIKRNIKVKPMIYNYLLMMVPKRIWQTIEKKKIKRSGTE